MNAHEHEDVDAEDIEALVGLVFQAAGVGAGAVMRLAPDVVMPEQEISHALRALLAEYGIDLAQVDGYERVGQA
jgi:hypothetical protein